MKLQAGMTFLVIEDAAQSFGATYKGKKSCNLSKVGSTFFFPIEAPWMLWRWRSFTNDDELAEKFRWIRVHGQERKHHHPILGINGRMDTIQAAILLEILEVFPDEVKKLENLGQAYSKGLSHCDSLETPIIGVHNTPVYAQYTILIERREQIQQSLKEKKAFHQFPIIQSPFISSLYLKILVTKRKISRFPEKVANQCLSLPMSPYLTVQEQSLVIEAIL